MCKPFRSDALLLASTALAPLIWGSTYWVTTAFLPPDRPLHAALLRCLPAGVLLLCWARQWPARREWAAVLLLGVLNIGFFQAMLFVAAYRLPGGLAAILTSTQTLMVLALSWLMGRQAQPRAAWCWAAAGVAGMGLLVYAPQARWDVPGVVAALLGAASMALGLVLSRRWQTGMSLLAFTGWQLLAGGVFLLPLALWLELPLPALSWRHVGAYAYLCLAGAVLAYGLFFRGVRRLPPAVVSSLGLLSPVCAAVLGWVLLDQRLSPAALLGFVLVLLSIFGVQRALHAASASKACLS
ncbi:MAG: EamA family transporter [Pseudomonadota bacterium]|nr:EamA family transporter [Pseudomonadota bacterium]